MRKGRAELELKEERSLCSILSFVTRIMSTLMVSLGQPSLPQPAGQHFVQLEDKKNQRFPRT